MRKNNPILEEKVCKRCGEPLRSTSKYKYCDNCRRENAKKKKEIGGAIFGVCVMALGSVPVIKHFVKKS